MTSLPLDLLLEIAACSDPATLVRCAATCRDFRRRVTDDPTFRGRLRLRHADRFVPSLLRGFLIERRNKYNKDELHLVDTTTAAADTIKLVTVADGFPPPDADELSRRKHKLLASRDGLVLVHVYGEQLRVCDPATGHSHTLPPEPAFSEGAQANSVFRKGQANSFWEPYVFLVEGGAGVGRRRPFQVLKTNLALSFDCRYLQIHTFSSEKNGTWSPYVKIQTPEVLRGFRLLPGGGRPLVTAGSVVHWLCPTDVGCYVLSLDASTAQVSVTTLPKSFPRMDHVNNDRKYLLATTPTGERPVVLVADKGYMISLWTQSKLTAKWKQRPEVVSMNETFVRLAIEGGTWMQRRSTEYYNTEARLHWFAERSGVALIEIICHGFFLFDLSSKEILRRFSDSQLTSYLTTCCPYEMDLSSWVPTINCTL